MFERIKTALQRWLIIRQLKRLGSKDVPVTLSVNDQWEEIDTILVLMTAQVTGAPAPVFARLRDRFPDAQIITLMLPEASISVSDSIYEDTRISFIRIEPMELTKFGLPGQQLKNHLAEYRAEVAIDLSLNFVPLSGLLCFLSGARVKVGFSGPEADLVFNYQVAPHSDRNDHERYDVMAHYIG